MSIIFNYKFQEEQVEFFFLLFKFSLFLFCWIISCTKLIFFDFPKEKELGLLLVADLYSFFMVSKSPGPGVLLTLTLSFLN